MWHGYVLVENIALTPVQVQLALAALGQSGSSFSPYPFMNTHYAVRSDGNAALAESNWYEDKLHDQYWNVIASAALGIPMIAMSTIDEVTEHGYKSTTLVSGTPVFSVMIFWSDENTLYEESRNRALAYRDSIPEWSAE